MRNLRGKRGFVFLSFLFLTVAFPGSGKAQERKNLKGEVVYATMYHQFGQRGGDPATHFLGAGPLISTTIFDGLVDRGPKVGDYRPALAESWRVADDLLSVEFRIRKGVKFHNGDGVTAEDVKYSLDQYMRPELKSINLAIFKQYIRSIDVLDPYRVRVNLHQPWPGLFGRLWWLGGIFPKNYREKVGDAGFADKPVGAGPFRWVEYKQDVYWKGEAVENHYRKTPEFKTLKMVYVPEPSTRLAMLKAGEADIVLLHDSQIPQVKSDSSLRVVLNKNWQIVTLGFADLVFPNEPSPFHDLRVREAVSLAIDRKAICEKILNSGADPWGDVHSQQTLGYDPANQPDPYDPRKARALLREAGYPNGFETKIHTAATWKRELEAVAANLAAVGIKAKLEVYEWGAWAAAHRGKKMRGLFRQHLTFNTDRHPGSQLTTQQDPQSPWSYGLSTPEINEIIAKSMHAKTDEDLMSFGKKLSKVMRERRANVILWSTSSGYGLGPRIAEWVHQESTYPCTAFEYLKVKEGK